MTYDDLEFSKSVANYDQFRSEVKLVISRLAHSKGGQSLLNEMFCKINEMQVSAGSLVDAGVVACASLGLKGLMLELYNELTSKANTMEGTNDESED